MEWISVKDRLPEEPFLALWTDLRVTVIEEKEKASFCINKGIWKSVYSDKVIKVTHWQPLPEPPKEDN